MENRVNNCNIYKYHVYKLLIKKYKKEFENIPNYFKNNIKLITSNKMLNHCDICELFKDYSNLDVYKVIMFTIYPQ